MPELAVEPRTFTRRTTCSFCGTGCTLSVTVEDGSIVGVEGDKRGPVNHGESCIKGIQAWTYVHSDKRLRVPLIRRGDVLEPASWDEALDRITREFARIRDESGPDAISCLSSSRATNETNYLAQKLMRQVIGTNNIDSCNRT
ncbi:molybdopterin-dependent oxidoreductase [Alicyclobacillus curvatus]|nr:molybdopterin-dependent oxidoreductase [Alicyclobacillus curvatus]